MSELRLGTKARIKPSTVFLFNNVRADSKEADLIYWRDNQTVLTVASVVPGKIFPMYGEIEDGQIMKWDIDISILNFFSKDDLSNPFTVERK